VADYDEVNIAELKRVIVVTAVDDKRINFRHYEVNPGKTVNETDVKNKMLQLNEIGPRFEMTFRRDKIASHELFKTACKQPKLENPEKKKAKKNLFTDNLGQ
jgi:ribosome production factor 2